ncbi:hypothetical protein NFI96_008934 [Prochilodus magdalenae]|nr:hypothetical protein NFI96_008934 [Prochilodus magdalenae]
MDPTSTTVLLPLLDSFRVQADLAPSFKGLRLCCSGGIGSGVQAGESMMSPGHSHQSPTPPESPGSHCGGPSRVHFSRPSQSRPPSTATALKSWGQGPPVPPPVSTGQHFHEEGLSGSMQDPQQSGGEAHSMQDFLPAVQKALLLHLNQNQQDSDVHRPDGQHSVPSGRDRDETTNWYSSDDEDGSSVTAILKTLKKQNEMLKTQQTQQKLQQPGAPQAPLADPRLHKERPLLLNDPRLRVDPRQHSSDTRKDVDAVLDPRLARDPRKMKSMEAASSKLDPHRHPHPISSTSQKPPAGDEDEDGERELREKAALIPLDPSPGATLRDPRCQIKQFSHIRVDILLQHGPAFAHSVVLGSGRPHPLC